MNRERQPSPSPVALPHQEALLERLLRADGPRAALLVAPPGTGKSFTAALIAHETIVRRPGAQVLVLVPSALITGMAEWLERLARGHGQVRILDGAALRELEADVKSRVSGLPDNVVAVVGHGASRIPSMRVLGDLEWDLVVLDEAQSAPDRLQQLVRDLLVSQRAARAVMMAAYAPRADLLNELPQVEQVGWTDAEALSALGGRAHRRVVTHYFRRTGEEQELARFIIELTADRSSEAWRALRGPLLRALASSPAAAERFVFARLDRLRQLRNACAHGIAGDEEIREATRWTHMRGVASAELASELEKQAAHLSELAERLGDLTADARLSDLTNLIHESLVSSDCLGVAVICSLAATVDYVADGLEIAGFSVHRATAGVGAQLIASRVQRFEEQGEVLVASEAALGGVTLGARDLVAFDLPVSPARLEQWWGLIDRLGRQGEIRLHVFVEESGSNPAESRPFLPNSGVADAWSEDTEGRD